MPPHPAKERSSVAPHQPKTSVLLIELRDAFPGDDTITVREVLDRLEGRAIGLLLLFLALPNCIPNIPGISTVFGVLLIAPALQMIFGSGRPWLPRRVADFEIKPSTLRAGIDASIPSLKRVEKLVQPRLEFLTQKPMTILAGVQVLILAGILILPIPFANWLPGMSVAALAIGIIQRDGIMALVSVGFFIASLAVAPLGVGMGLAALDWLVGAVSGFFAGLFGG